MNNLPINKISNFLNIPVKEIDSLIPIIENNWIELIHDAKFKYSSIILPLIIKNSTFEISNQFSFKSSKLAKMLIHSNQIFFYSATLGLAVDKKLKLKSYYNLEDALVYNACANSLIEIETQKIFDTLKKQQARLNKYTSIRFSPGYLDLDLSNQNLFLSITNSTSKIGLTLSNHLALIPEKSITAFSCISNRKLPTSYNCSLCDFYNKCLSEGGFKCEF